MTFRCIILTWLRQTWINYLKKISSLRHPFTKDYSVICSSDKTCSTNYQSIDGQISANVNKRRKKNSMHTISQLCPVKLSRHSHLYDPGRLIQVFAARHGWIVLHSSISIEQSIPVHPGSKSYDLIVHFSILEFSPYHKHRYIHLINQDICFALDMDLIDIHQSHIDIDHQQILNMY